MKFALDTHFLKKFCRKNDQMTTSNLVVPMVLWGQNAPTHCVASIMMSPDQQHVITGCNDGQICVWEVKENWKVIILFVAIERKTVHTTYIRVLSSTIQFRDFLENFRLSHTECCLGIQQRLHVYV